MARDITPWTQRLRELVEAGPVRRDKAEAEMLVLVSPGQGLRITNYVNDWVRDKHGYKTKRDEDPEDPSLKGRRITSGQRRIARSALWTQVHHKRVEEFIGEDGQRWLRKGPNPWPVPEAVSEGA